MTSAFAQIGGARSASSTQLGRSLVKKLNSVTVLMRRGKNPESCQAALSVCSNKMGLTPYSVT